MTIDDTPLWLTAVALAPALIIALAAIAAMTSRTGTGTSAWRGARLVTTAATGLAVVVTTARIATGASADALVRIDTVTAAMMLLVGIVGWAVIRYSHTYMDGDPHQRRYVVRMLATLAAVSLVVVTNNVVVLVLAWGAASVALHGLLTFYPDRPVAVAVAHKKFVLARCADVAMVGAVIAFVTATDTFRIDGIVATIVADGLTTGGRVGILLVAVAALLKTAQLPFHGWLIQVMEAPTPVSALLHAGVVNLGGFVLLRFAPVVDLAVETRTLLVVVGALTALAASLVMTTRVSVKVALAWSTCAQMGFMIMQCGLGLWEMAMLHLLAHSLYKAHAFLSAGGTVRLTQRRQLAGAGHRPTASAVALGAVLAFAATAAVGLLWNALAASTDLKSLTATVWVLMGIVALALVPLTVPSASVHPGRHLRTLLQALAVPVVYLVLHEVAGRLVPTGDAAPAALLVVVGLVFATLFGLQALITLSPTGTLTTRIRPWIYAGLFLDDGFTRVAFRVVPPPTPAAPTSFLPRPATTAVFAVTGTTRVEAIVDAATSTTTASTTASMTTGRTTVGTPS